MNYIKDTLEYLSKFFQWWVIIQPWEAGIRSRFGKRIKLLNPGTHFRVPFFDTVFIKTIRLKTVSMSPQTLTSQDGKTITIVVAAGYSITDIEKLYNTLCQPEVTICNTISAEIAEYVANNNLIDCTPKKIQDAVDLKLNGIDYGLKYDYVKLVGYAVVRTYRLIQEGHWMQNNLDMNAKE